ncbi:MAG: prolyl oligopeptidase family serine peptidase [Actinomycetota bacterium]|nr:prolyl oligopeptidase family serine peptidase [Actinomycetota bacterium]
MSDLGEVMSQAPRGDVLPAFILQQAQLHAQQCDRKSSATASQGKTELRERIAQSLGLPRLPRSDLSLTVLDTIDREDFTVQKLVFESTPGLPVPAHLYVPCGGSGPHPAAVHVPGHWMENAKLEPDIQRLNFHLVQNGIVTLCYDPLGQGERRVGWHQHGQLAPLLVGFTSMSVMVRDSMAALDVLERQEAVDGSRLGMLGASGGGFSTIFTAALDERVTAAAIGCIVNSHVGQLRDAAFGTGWDSWVDVCNQVPGLCLVGSMAEILSATLPRDLLVANADQDPAIPLSSVEEVVTELRDLAKDQGAVDRFEFSIVPGGHGLHPAMRQTMATFAVRKLAGRRAQPLTETTPLLAREWEVVHNLATAQRPQSIQRRPSDASCWDAPIDSNGPVVALARELALTCRERRSVPSASDVRTYFGPFPPKPAERPYVSLHVATPTGYAQRLRIPIEEGIDVDAVLVLPRNWTDDLSPVFVMLDERGKTGALHSPEVDIARSLGYALLLPDLRGTGEMRTSEFEIASAAWMLERDLLNQRLCDTLGVIGFVSDRYSTGAQIDKGRIVLWGNGAFGILAGIVAAIDDRVAAVGTGEIESLEELLVVNSEVTPMAYRYGVLQFADLADLAELVKPRGAFVGVKRSQLSSVIEQCRSIRLEGVAR